MVILFFSGWNFESEEYMELLVGKYICKKTYVLPFVKTACLSTLPQLRCHIWLLATGIPSSFHVCTSIQASPTPKKNIPTDGSFMSNFDPPTGSTSQKGSRFYVKFCWGANNHPITPIQLQQIYIYIYLKYNRKLQTTKTPDLRAVHGGYSIKPRKRGCWLLLVYWRDSLTCP